MKVFVFLLLIGSAAIGQTAAAQTLSLKFNDGAVTLDAANVTVDEILARWTKTTGLTVVSQNGHGSDVPVTLHLSAVPEREALRLVLRDLSGYIMGERLDPQTGAIRIDRLLILPDSAARPFVPPSSPARRPRARAAQTPPAVPGDVPVELAPTVGATAPAEP